MNKFVPRMNELHGVLAVPEIVNYGGVNTAQIEYDTTAGWAAKRNLRSKEKVIYVYTDYETDADGNNIPAFKIGDGSAYVADLPFVSHVTQEEKNFWNNKVSVFALPEQEMLYFTTH